MIKIGDNPQGVEGINKFIGIQHEGLRGKLVAIKKGGKEAIILSLNTEQGKNPNRVVWGKLYLVKEDTPTNYPVTVKQVLQIPDDDNWIVACDCPNPSKPQKPSGNELKDVDDYLRSISL